MEDLNLGGRIGDMIANLQINGVRIKLVTNNVCRISMGLLLLCLSFDIPMLTWMYTLVPWTLVMRLVLTELKVAGPLRV